MKIKWVIYFFIMPKCYKKIPKYEFFSKLSFKPTVACVDYYTLTALYLCLILVAGFAGVELYIRSFCRQSGGFFKSFVGLASFLLNESP